MVEVAIRVAFPEPYVHLTSKYSDRQRQVSAAHDLSLLSTRNSPRGVVAVDWQHQGQWPVHAGG